MNVGTTLKLLRTTSNITQISLAKELEVSANYISLVENARKEPSLKLLRNYAKIFNAPLGYLLWLALEDEVSSEEIDLQRKMDRLLVNIIRGKGINSEITKNGDEEKT